MKQNIFALIFALLLIPATFFILLSDFKLVTQKRMPGDSNLVVMYFVVATVLLGGYYYWFFK
jgi:hypothetical protein